MPFVFISLPSTKGPEDANAVTSVNTSATIKNIKKKDNLNVSPQLLTYDYIYFNNISPTINKKLNPIITLIFKFLSITKDKAYIRFYFCAKNTLVKYIYVPEFR